MHSGKWPLRILQVNTIRTVGGGVGGGVPSWTTTNHNSRISQDQPPDVCFSRIIRLFLNMEALCVIRTLRSLPELSDYPDDQHDYDGIYEIMRNLMKTPGLLRLMSSWWFTKKKKSVWCSFVFFPTDTTLSVWRFFFFHPGEDFHRPPVSCFYLMSYQPGRVPRKVMPILFSNLSLMLKFFWL